LLPAIAGLLAAGAAAAQDRAPIRLIPVEPPPPAVNEQPPQSLQPLPPSQPPERPQRKTPAPRVIAVAPAGAASADSVGLPGFEGGFGLPLWRGSSRQAVARLLAGLPQTVASPALRDVLFRVLAAGAKAPEGEGPPLIPLRIRQMRALGYAVQASRLARAAGLETPGGEPGSDAVDPALAAGDLETACAAADAEMMRAPSAYVQRTAAFCAVRAGDIERARLILDLLREVGDAGDAPFQSLILRTMDSAAGDTAPPLPKDGPSSPLNVAMRAYLGEELPQAWAGMGGLRAFRARAGLLENTAAVEEAARDGLLPPEKLLAYYLRSDSGGHPRALLARAAVEAAAFWAAAIEGAEPRKTLDALSSLWEDALSAGLFTPVAAATIGLAAPVSPSPGLAQYTGAAITAALAANRFDIAERWYLAAVERGAEQEDDIARAVLAWPLMKLADAEGVVNRSENGLRRWLQAGGGAPPHPRADMLFALLEALGEPVSNDDWTALLGALDSVSGDFPAPVVWRGLAAAGRSGRIGEAVLYAVIASGGRALGHPSTAAAIVQALSRVGLAAEARAYAFECLVEAAR